jgi:hypothetical protein
VLGVAMVDHAENTHTKHTKHVVVGGCHVLANIHYFLQATIMVGELACMDMFLDA